MKTKKKNKEEGIFYEKCLLEEKLDAKQSGLFKLNGMCFVLEKFPELKATCPDCFYFKEIPPKSYSCRRFFCTLEKVEK
jgi:hypothetical protein